MKLLHPNSGTQQECYFGECYHISNVFILCQVYRALFLSPESVSLQMEGNSQQPLCLKPSREAFLIICLLLFPEQVLYFQTRNIR